MTCSRHPLAHRQRERRQQKQEEVAKVVDNNQGQVVQNDLFGVKVKSAQPEVVKKMIKRNFTKEGFLTSDMFQKVVERDSRINKHLNIVKTANRDLTKAVNKAVKQEGDSLGGIYEVVVTGVPPGLGSFVHWDRKLDGKLAQAILRNGPACPTLQLATS